MENNNEHIPSIENPNKVPLKDITSTTTMLENNSKLRGRSRKRSWIWDHFKDLPTNQGSKGRCKELKKDGSLCNHVVETDGDNGIYKEQVDKALVEFIVTDSQPFYMLENPGFIKYSLVLSPSYKLPSNKGIKNKIYLAYDWMSEVVHSKLKESMKYCGLMTNLWTARCNSEFIGVTCSYIDPQFKIQEISLTIHELKHLHSDSTIAIL
ncbi:21217_t:CDS:2 [Cetraspora pellucida]|uniref:21217_t:CDS:1 n=1 Tax=Cetraspora pellucida TaxID=1433469 RepID=A0A9N9IFT8_9GLOM|nr:21217_t:CDS:2 [Cetraspora pellucida]